MFEIVRAGGWGENPGPVIGTIAAGLRGALGKRRARVVLAFASSTYGRDGLGSLGRELGSGLGCRIVGCGTTRVLGDAPAASLHRGASALALAGDGICEPFLLRRLRGRSEELGREIGSMVRRLPAPRAVLLFADSYQLAPDELLAGISSASPDCVVVGGGATEAGRSGETLVLTEDGVAHDAVAGLLIAGVPVRVATWSSCRVVGPWRRVTSAESNRIGSLDGRRAAEVLQADLPTFFRSAPETIPETIRVALRDRVPGPKERDPAFVIRRLIGVDPRSGEMAIGDEAPEGSACALAVRDPVAAREAVDGGALGLGREEPPMAGGLFLAGLGRGHELHGFEGLDLAYLGHRLPSLPIASLEVSMTFAPLADRNRFHLEAGTFIGFGPGALSSIPPDR